jgi:hypothetical protein
MINMFKKTCCDSFNNFQKKLRKKSTFQWKEVWIINMWKKKKFGLSISIVFYLKNPFKKDDVQHNVFLEDLVFLVMKNLLPLQFMRMFG